jgi:hypothetical protein
MECMGATALRPTNNGASFALEPSATAAAAAGEELSSRRRRPATVGASGWQGGSSATASLGPLAASAPAVFAVLRPPLPRTSSERLNVVTQSLVQAFRRDDLPLRSAKVRGTHKLAVFTTHTTH